MKQGINLRDNIAPSEKGSARMNGIASALNEMYILVWATTDPNTAALFAWIGVIAIATTATLTICKVSAAIVRMAEKAASHIEAAK